MQFKQQSLIHKCSTNSLLCATTASTWVLLSAWLNSLTLWQFTNQPASYALLLTLPFSVFPWCAHTQLVRYLFLNLMLLCLSGTVSLAKLDHQTLTAFDLNHVWNLTSSSYPIDCACVCIHVCVCVFVCACLRKFVLTCFVLHFVLQFGEIARKKVHYYY